MAVRTLTEAVQFAIGKLSNEVAREFDGSTVGRAERRDYARTVALLSQFVESGGPEFFEAADVAAAELHRIGRQSKTSVD